MRQLHLLVGIWLAGCTSVAAWASESAQVPTVDTAAALVASVCLQDPQVDAGPALAAHLKVHPLNVHKGLGRYNVLQGKALESWCALPPAGLRQALGIALSPKKSPDAVKASANRESLEFTLKDADGKIDAAGYALAVAQRRALVHDTATVLKRAAQAVSASPTNANTTAASARAQPLLAGLPTTAGGWSNLSGYIHPVGRINDLLIDKGATTSTRTMWAATDGGGIWKTSNGGSTWAPVNDFNGSLSIGKIVRSPRNALEMYASTNPYGSHTYSPFGVLKSNDGGVTWAQLPQTNPAVNGDWQYVTHLAIHPSGASGADVLLAATISGAYESTDSGASWRKLSTGSSASFVGFHPANGDLRAYALNDGTLTLTSSGNWSQASVFTVLAGTARAYTKFAFAASDPSVLYAMASDATGRTTLLRSTNTGAAWTPLTPPTNFYYNNGYLYYTGGLWVDPTNAKRMATFEGWVATTADATTANAAAGWQQSPIGWVDFHGAVADPDFNGTTNKIIYLMDDGGLYKFNDVDTLGNGSFLATGMTITETYSASGRGGNIIFGAQDVGPRVYRNQLPSDAMQRWRFMSNPAQCNGCSWIGDGATTAVAHDNNQALYGSRQYLDLIRSTDGGVTGSSLCGVAPTSLTEGRCGNNFNTAFIAPFVLDPNNSATMLAGGRSLWRSTNVSNGTPTWSVIHTAAGATATSAISAIAVAPSDSNTVWLAHQDGSVYKTTNGLDSAPAWSVVSAAPRGSKLKIYIDRSNASVVYLGLAGFSGNTLYRTTNGGTSWSAVPGLPAASVMALEQHPANPLWLYAGTAVGLFSSQDGGTTWSTTNEGPANVQIKDLSWYATSGNSAELLVASFGRGVWRATVSAGSDDTLAADTDKVFSWAERTYPSVFTPAGGTTQTLPGYRYRAYANGSFLAVNTSGTPHLFYLGPLSNNIVLDLGDLAQWLSKG